MLKVIIPLDILFSLCVVKVSKHVCGGMLSDAWINLSF